MGYKHNKENILKVGYEVFRTNGYHNVGINKILKESGIPKGSFYNFFESKEDFAQQVIKQYGESNYCWMQDFFEECDLSPIECLKSFYSFMINLNEKDEYNGGCLVNNMSVEVGRQNDTLGSEANQHFMGWLNILAMEITKGQDAGEITKDFSALELAEYMHSGFYGVLARTKVTRNRVYMDIWFEMTFKFISV
ncbi:TetR/AcrR family transcriptional regulator [Winogradskyella maritima]|uniref:TetR/AcrR family transcriptional regulator n=1 Tax=Winogradskyella maritima TaxID=1517766 RepID=A0ABV8AFR5_9FLAO|nr:TetR/AcrR family transcriptional regulator [Winogradskyella maritima]